MKPVIKICICAVVAAALIAALCVLLVPSTRWSLPELLDFNGYPDEESYHIGADTVTETVDSVELHWASGAVRITTHTGSGIRLTETGYRNERQQLRWRVRDGRLIIRAFASGLNWSLPGKTLELSLPEGSYRTLSIDTASAGITLSGPLSLDKLELDTASGSFAADGITANDVSFDSASGDCRMTDCTAAKFDMDTASGNATLSGSFDSVELDSASGDLELHAAAAPRKLETDTVSGRVRIYLPARAEFRAALDSVSGNLNVSDFAGTYRDDEFRCGEAENSYRFESVSGDVDIAGEK